MPKGTLASRVGTRWLRIHVGSLVVAGVICTHQQYIDTAQSTLFPCSFPVALHAVSMPTIVSRLVGLISNSAVLVKMRVVVPFPHTSRTLICANPRGLVVMVEGLLSIHHNRGLKAALPSRYPIHGVRIGFRFGLDCRAVVQRSPLAAIFRTVTDTHQSVTSAVALCVCGASVST